MINRRNGTLRRQRNNEALLNSPFQIDQRSFWEVIGYMSSLMEKINFYDFNNQIDGNWKEFLEMDGVVYMVSIINTSTKELERDIVNYSPDNSTTQIDLKTAKKLLDWHNTISTWQKTVAGHGVPKVARKIESILDDVLAREKMGLQILVDRCEKELKAQEKKDKESRDLGMSIKSIPSPIPIEVMTSADLDRSLHTFHRVIMHIKESIKDYLEENLLASNRHEPNNALYLAFALLYKRLQEQINTLSQRHLDFYYEDILKQNPKPGSPTHAVVCFELLPTVSNSLIAEGTPMTAGKLFGSKEEIVFETVHPLVAYQMELLYAQTVFLNNSPFMDVGTYSPIVSSISWKQLIHEGKVFTPKDEWYAFGANKRSLQNINTPEGSVAQVGCIIGSPVLYLSEGERAVKLIFTLEKITSHDRFWELLHQIKDYHCISMDVVFYKVFTEGFKISYTTKKGWVPFESYAVTFDEGNNQFMIDVSLGATDPAFEHSEKITESLKWPSIKIELNEYAPTYLYSFFQGVEIERVDIDVAVNQMKDLIVYNNVGKMTLGKPFELFGPLPDVGSYLMIGNSELFRKKVTGAQIDIDWDGLPQDYGGLECYYAGYPVTVTNDAYKMTLSVLSEGYWLPADPSKAPVFDLFSTSECRTPEGYPSVQLDTTTQIKLGKFSDLNVVPDLRISDPLLYSIKSNSGFLKLTLTEPSFGFGSDAYQEELAAIARYNATKKKQIPNPNQPLVPKVSDISLSYTASDALLFNENDLMSSGPGDNLGQYFHLEPYGTEPVIRDQQVKQYTMFPSFSAQGYLTLGIKTKETGMNVSIYFHFLRSSTSINVKDNAVQWEYGEGLNWQPFEENDIVKDGTDGFIRSGIVELILPTVEKNQHLTNNELIWIRAGVQTDVENYPKIKGIYLNAVLAVCPSDDPQILGKRVQNGSITKMDGKYPDIKAVIQPAESFAGKMAEAREHLYTRVSERLRHKSRCVGVWDFERIILENFKNVRVVKCTNFDKKFKPIPGQVKITVLSSLWTHKERHYFNRVTLNRMQKMVDELSSPFLNVEVINPEVEYLLVNCVVHFKPEDTGGYYLNKLNNDISDFLSPVSNMDDGIGGIGGRIVPNMLVDFVENLDYIEKLEDLNIEHIVRRKDYDFVLDTHSGVDEIRTSVPWAILAPVQEHNLSAYVSDAKTKEAMKVSIANLAVGMDFILGEEPEETPEKVKKQETPKEDRQKEENAVLVFKDKSEKQ